MHHSEMTMLKVDFRARDTRLCQDLREGSDKRSPREGFIHAREYLSVRGLPGNVSKEHTFTQKSWHLPIADRRHLTPMREALQHYQLCNNKPSSLFLQSFLLVHSLLQELEGEDRRQERSCM